MIEWEIIKINRILSRINAPNNTAAERQRDLYIIADIFDDYGIIEWATAIRAYLRRYNEAGRE